MLEAVAWGVDEWNRSRLYHLTGPHHVVPGFGEKLRFFSGWTTIFKMLYLSVPMEL